VGKGGTSGTRHVLLLKCPHRSLKLWSKFSLLPSLALQGCVLPIPKGWGITQILVDTLGLVVQQYVLSQTWGYWPLSNALATSISFICQMWVDSLTPNSSEAYDFDGELQILWQHMQKHGTSSGSLSFIYIISF